MKSLLKTLFALKFIAVLGVVGGVMIWVGATGIRNAQQETPQLYDKIENIELKGDKWITVKNGSLDILASVYLDDLSGKKIEEIFIPVNTSDVQSQKFYLQTKDSRLISIFSLVHSLSQKIQSEYMTIKMAEKDPQYLKFLKKTIPELEKEVQKSEAELEFYRKKHASLVQSFSGMLDLEFGSTEKYSALLGKNSHIIKHNETPAAGFYSWFLTITGSLLSLLALLSLIGLFTKTQKHEPKS